MRDRELQRLADSRRFGRDDWSRPEPEDEFAGLMSQRERQWVVNIQLSQLKCENPFLVISFVDTSGNPNKVIQILVNFFQLGLYQIGHIF